MPKAETKTIHHTAHIDVQAQCDRCSIDNNNLSMQMRLEYDGTVYIDACNDFDWKDKIVAANLPFDVLWTEFRKFCEAMRAMERAAKDAKGGGQ